MNRFAITLAFAGVLTFAACGGNDNNKGSTANHHDGDGKDHKHEGTPHHLGTHKIAGYNAAITQMGECEPNKEAVYEVKIDGGADALENLVVMVSLVDATGAIVAPAKKADFNAHPEHRDFDAHLQLRDKCPKDMKVVVEISDSKGGKGSASLAPHMK